jgi:hypothetical protein
MGGRPVRHPGRAAGYVSPTLLITLWTTCG